MSEAGNTIKPTNDLMFKKMLSSEGSKEVLQGFLADFCSVRADISEIHILTPYNINVYRELLKEGQVDVGNVIRETQNDIAVAVDSADVIIEIQVYSDNYYMQRVHLYMAERYRSNYDVEGRMSRRKKPGGEPGGRLNRYSSLRPVHSVNIVKWKRFPDGSALHRMAFYDLERKVGLPKDYMTLVFFELGKPSAANSNLEHWRTLFNTGEAGEGAPGYVRKASSFVSHTNLTEEERSMATRLDMAQAAVEAI
jgi:hypothetical protein